MTILSTIQSRLDSFSPAGHRVAEVVLSEPGVVLRLSIADLAKTCGTSEATIVRFCRALGLRGYAEFRVTLAAELGAETRRRLRTRLADPEGRSVVGGDSLEEIVSTIAFVETLTLEETIANLDIETLKRAVLAIDGAHRIFTFGIGSSGSCAEDFQRKLTRMGRPAQSLREVEEAVISASYMRPRDVLIAFSHSGSTSDVARVIELAARRSATTIAVTNARNSPVGRAAKYVIETTVRETTLRAASMGARTAQAFVADCLCGVLAHRNLDQAQRALRETGTLLATFRSAGRSP